MKRLLLYISLVVMMLPTIKGADENNPADTTYNPTNKTDIKESEMLNIFGGTNEYLSSNKITANNSITGGATVHYGAGSQVRLTQGFSVAPGCNFIADLNGSIETSKNNQDFGDNKKAIDFNIYPNPSTGKFKIVTSGDEVKQIAIYNTTGILVYSDRSSNTEIEIDLGNIVSGLYIVKLKSSDINNTKTLLIKQLYK